MTRLTFSCLMLAACHESATVAGGTADAQAGANDAAAACGARTGQRGKTMRTVRAGALDRTYLVYLPPAVEPGRAIPLVFVHHGYSMSAESMFEITGYPALADAEHFALAFPDGQSGPNAFGAPWNVGTGLCPAASGAQPPVATGDDFAMLDAIRADIARDQCIDEAHVFVTGFSMGGYFANHAGCMRDDIRAIAPHSGGAHTLDDCPVIRKPVIIFHGGADTLVPDDCADPDVPARPGVEPSAALWARRNGCAPTTTTTAVRGGSCAYYDGCPNGGQVALCTFTAMGHCWAGGRGPSVYSCEGYEDATALAWGFFESYAWQ